jgi:hypothetical protein
MRERSVKKCIFVFLTMIAASGSARLVVINSSRASGRHQVRRTKTQSSSQRSLSSLGPTAKPPELSSRLSSSVGPHVEQRALASTYAATSRRSAAVTSSKELAQDLSFLSSTLQNGGGANHAGSSGSETSNAGGWTRAELFASGLLALAATGSFLMASSVAASPSTAMQQAAQSTVSRFPFSKNGGGGGGSPGGGGDPSPLKPFFSARKHNEDLVTESEISGEFVGKPYDVSLSQSCNLSQSPLFRELTVFSHDATMSFR